MVLEGKIIHIVMHFSGLTSWVPSESERKVHPLAMKSGFSHGFLYNWIGRLFLPSAWLGHSLIFYNFKTIHLKLIKFDENMVLWLVNQNFEKNQVLMYHFSSNACLSKLNLNLREKKSWFSNACNFLRKPFSNLLKHELYFN